jgi:hypothetical protein
MKQRAQYAAGRLPHRREKALKQEGFEFAPWEDRWEEAFTKLTAFRRREGHANVPSNWSRDPSLASWVAKQRDLWRKGELQPKRERRLRRLGFRFEPFEELWEEAFAKFETFRRRQGHANVPANFSRDPSLGVWVVQQRARWQRGELRLERERRLRKLGFSFELARGAAAAER